MGVTVIYLYIAINNLIMIPQKRNSRYGKRIIMQLTFNINLKQKAMKKVLIIMFLAILPLVSCEKKQSMETSDDRNYVLFEGKQCPIVDVVKLESGKTVLIMRATGKQLDYTVIPATENSPMEIKSNTKDMAVWGVSCHCQCCGIGWSMRADDLPNIGCWPCLSCSGTVQNPYYYFGCNCGWCTMFLIGYER
jgi:hypothetical protein